MSKQHSFALDAIEATIGWRQLTTRVMPTFGDTPDETGRFRKIEAQQGLHAGGVASVYGHLEKVIKQGNCPFAPMVASAQGVHLHLDQQYYTGRGQVSMVVMRTLLAMIKKFFELSPVETKMDRGRPDETTLIWLFLGTPDILATSGGFCREFSQARKFYAPVALACGLTVADSGPGHTDEEGDGRNVTGWPMLIMHRLHREDRAFMESPIAQEIFASFFGSKERRDP